MSTSRELALNILYKIEFGEGYSNIEIDKEFNKSDLLDIDKSLASELVYGVITWKISLDEIIKMHSKIKLRKISPFILNILRMGIYQIVFLDRIPNSAAVNESVKLAKKYGHEASAKFVNAVLRKIEKNEMEKLLDSLGTKPIQDDEIISIVTSHPLWLVDKLLEQYDKKFVTELLNANNQKSEITIRANTLYTSRDDLYNLLELKNIDCKKGNLPDSIKLKKLHDFSNKLYTVQDEAAQRAVLELDVKSGDKVLDACSAPGGKTTYMANIMNNDGRIDAWDIHAHRVELVKKAAEHLDIKIINAKVKDATEYDTLLNNHYDKILLDVPCTGIGVIRKKPDIKWTRKEEDIYVLADLAKQILNTCSNYLKIGGRLVFSTCTVLKEENENHIKDFLNSHDDFKLIKQINLFPHIDDTDGFYIAVLERI